MGNLLIPLNSFRDGQSAQRHGPLPVHARGVRSSIFCELAEDRAKEATILLARNQFTGELVAEFERKLFCNNI
jgi:hypothetical protein